MELRHLRYFAAVAETRHFGRAAERLHMAQPALSQSIRQLEAELGTPLFARTTRQVRLTPAGEFFQLEVARILARRSRPACAAYAASPTAGRASSASPSPAAPPTPSCPRMARIVKRELPGMALEIHADLLTPAQVDGLHDGTLDLGVLRPPMPGDGLASRTLSTEPLVLAVAEDHPLAHRAGHLDDRPAHRAASSCSPVPTPRSTTPSCAAPRRSASCRIREHEAAGISVLLPLVAADLGVALVPASVRAAPLAGVVFRDVTDAATVDLALVWRADETNPAVLAVLDVLSADSPVALPDCRRGQPMKITRVEAIPFAIPYRKPLQVRQRRGARRRARAGAGHHRRRRRRRRRGTAASVHLRRDAGRRSSRSSTTSSPPQVIGLDLIGARADPRPALPHRRQPDRQVGPRHGHLGRPRPVPGLQRHRAARRLHRPDARLAHARLRRARGHGRRGRADARHLRHHHLQGEGRSPPLHASTPPSCRALREAPRRRRRAVRRRQPRLVARRSPPARWREMADLGLTFAEELCPADDVLGRRWLVAAARRPLRRRRVAW